jgi:hypothetical protein
LFEAAKYGRHEVVQLLLAAGADVNAEESSLMGGRTPLHVAAWHNHLQVAQLLLSAGANVNAADADGTAPMHAAAMAGCNHVLQLLLQHGADPQLQDADGDPALYYAACDGHLGVVKLLLEACGDPRVSAADLAAAAKTAARNEHMPTAAQLIKQLRKLHPADLHQLFEGEDPVNALQPAAALVDEWTSDASSIESREAAVCRREKEVSAQTAAVQQLILGMAGMAKVAEHRLAELEAREDGPEEQ